MLRKLSNEEVKTNDPDFPSPRRPTSVRLRGHRNKRRSMLHVFHNGQCSTSAMFAFCALASLLCLAVQTRLYFKTAQRQTRSSGSDNDNPRSFDGSFSKHLDQIRKNSASSQSLKNKHAKYEVYERQDSKTMNAMLTTILQRDRIERIAPRVVSLESINPLSFEIKQLIGLDESSGTNGNDRSSDIYSSNLAAGVDDESTAVENKDAIHDEAPFNQVDKCVPMAKWQTSVPVNCNTIHEIDIMSSVVNGAGKDKNQQTPEDVAFSNSHLKHVKMRHPSWNETQLRFLGQGWFRAAWRLDRQPPGQVGDTVEEGDDETEHETLILKMLRPERDFTEEFYELHRIDAVAMEQLTHSQFVLDVYGYCGQSALNELANFRVPELSSLEKFDRQLRGNTHPKINRIKLKMALSIATGLAHVHELPADIVGDDRPTMAHYDLNPRNVAIVKGGMPKLNDFNVAHFLKYNPETNETCGFESRLHEPWWRAPEEVSLNGTEPLSESVDVYSLGNLLFHILTTHSPRGKMKQFRMESVREDVLKGIPPSLPHELAKSKDPIVKAFRQAMDMCFVKDPKKRATARQVAESLFEAFRKIK